MSNQQNMPNQQNNTCTLRFSLPEKLNKQIQHMKFIDNDLLVYTHNDNSDEVKKAFSNVEFTLVPRAKQEYKLHVSATNKETFENVFGGMSNNIEERSSNGRFMVTITATNKEQYDLMLTKDGENDIRVKHFIERYANPSTRDPNTQQKWEHRGDRSGDRQTNQQSRRQTGRSGDRQYSQQPQRHQQSAYNV